MVKVQYSNYLGSDSQVRENLVGDTLKSTSLVASTSGPSYHTPFPSRLLLPSYCSYPDHNNTI